jgi:hypothetical protein
MKDSKLLVGSTKSYRNTFTNRYNVIKKYNRILFYVPDLNKNTVDISLEHCELRFPNHNCIECGWVRTMFFILTGI